MPLLRDRSRPLEVLLLVEQKLENGISKRPLRVVGRHLGIGDIIV